MQERINAYFNDPEVRREFVSAVSRLVGIKSVKGDPAPGAPFGPSPRAALDEAVKICQEMGFASGNYDNYVAFADLNDKPTQLHILGHLDVVGEGTDWDTDPYTCVEKDGMLYGRGVSDDKGPTLCALFAMRAVRELGLPVSKNVRLIMGTDEESGSSDIAYYYSKEPYAPQSFTPDADFPVINVEKGRYHPKFGRSWPAEEALPRVSAMTGGFRVNVVPPEAEAVVLGLKKTDVSPLCPAVESKTGASFTVTDTEGGVRIYCAGRNAHASLPEHGVNAIQAILEVLAQLPLARCESTKAIQAMQKLFPWGDTRGRALGIAQTDDISGELTVNLALMSLDETGFHAEFDCRASVCATEENCKKVCEASLAAYGISVLEHPDMTPSHMVDADSPLVRTLLECYSAYTGEKDPQPIAIGGGTYVHDIPGGVAFGCEFPGFDARMHCANERGRIEDLMQSAKMFALAIARLCE